MGKQVDLRPQNHGDEDLGEPFTVERAHRFAAGKFEQVNAGCHEEQRDGRTPETRKNVFNPPRRRGRVIRDDETHMQQHHPHDCDRVNEV